MRSFSETIRDEVWARLREIYMRFTRGNNNITIPQVEQFVVEVLGEKNRDELQYVTSNLSRLDQDGNGFIEFDEFANFLLKQHCGEIALQKMHRNSNIINHSQHKITFDEFNILLNNAYQFLGLEVDPKQTALLFNQADQDHDGLMTYVEYFQFVEKFICRPKIRIQKPSTPTQRIEFNSRFRKFLWEELIRIFAMYDINRNAVLSYSECHRLFRNIFQLSEGQIEGLLRRIFINGKTSLNFDQFVRLFITVVLGEGVIWHFGNNTHLSKDDFIRLLRLTLSFIDIDRVQDILFWRLYERIDTNRDGLISIDEYIRWINQFLSVPNYYGSQYISQDDDLTLNIGNNYISAYLSKPVISSVTTSYTPPVATMNISSTTVDPREIVVRRQIVTSGGMNFNPFNFSSQSLALRVRGHLLRLLIQFDTNHNRSFQQQEIIQMLITLMKQDRHEIMYVITNVFRYDRNGDRRVTYDEMCDFFLESHCGELAIQRLHKKQAYQRGAEKLMNLEEFIYTLNYALSFIEIQGAPQELAMLFAEIDRDHDGWITYREYFEFLKYYFGSKSYAAIETTIERIETMPMAEIAPVLNEFEIILMDNNLELEERLRRMLRLHLNKTLDAYDFDGNRMLTSNQIISLLQTLFGYDSVRVGYVMEILKRNPVMRRQEFVDLLLGIHFNQFGFLDELRLDRFHETDFIRIIDRLSSFLSVRFSPEQYTSLYRTFGVRNGGYLTTTQWEDWIARLFGRHTYITKTVTQHVDEFNSQIWLEFQRIFAFYDIGGKGYLTQSEIELFLRQVLLECQHKYRTTILADLLKLGPVSIERFASFILGRCAENALHRFHLQQPPGKDRLSERQFILLVQSAYDFLKPLALNTDLIKRSYAKVSNKHHDGVDYKSFIDWAYKDVAKRVY